uniref:UDP-galactopyranose mutase C-terminal domain-containing protein n=1 Tax=Octactis speculum TaxID=3111310 RepID=A0A7S2BDZ4_9STRA|mmetsp:Transcript_22327/g.30479  ORF Transcript_22327/g.30479 Transcript_22327/m.30479 type:complete len:510 (+) Transcript_22327:49-1578(+)|eukprot:CAMPEP_0185773182 /NCGR_PEP_ID=MMETSP1174-20130828/72375_1 /TAXON_ID=35687 /ORGANISM="Dictyocha speculum, Strain CCMP1381" /LENGTH=509 /DNA_ID=CAMNT_0028459751 /DNA_START=32 /DNA_END=1561 /DNA_ORIENTATION=-
MQKASSSPVSGIILASALVAATAILWWKLRSKTREEKKIKPKGPFASSVGVGRAEPEWAALNKVVGVTGVDPLFEKGETAEGPIPLSPEILSGDLSSAPQEVDLLIVGAGLSGAVIAERCSKELGMTSLVIDVRDHIGGNCYDYVESHGIRASKYGAHLFHTKYDRVWKYVTGFSEWMPFDHRVKGLVPDKNGVKKLVPIPPTQETVNALFGTEVSSEDEMTAWYESARIAPPSGDIKDAANGKEAALARVGPDLYEKIFKHYTKKQWDKYPEELDASVLMRLPCRTTTDDRYFSDPYQALPVRGYTRIFENMLLADDKITVRVNVDFFKAREEGKLPKYKMLVFTGPIDSYFSQMGMPKLEYRSLVFDEEYVPAPDGDFFQEAMVVNYPSPDVKFTRIVEYKHVPNQPTNVKNGEVKGSLIAREYSSDVGDPYYPVPNEENHALYEKYRELAEKEEGVCFVGRLASYKYFNMDQAILNALEIYDNLKETGKLAPKRRPQDFGPGDGPK